MAWTKTTFVHGEITIYWNLQTKLGRNQFGLTQTLEVIFHTTPPARPSMNDMHATVSWPGLDLPIKDPLNQEFYVFQSTCLFTLPGSFMML